MKWFFFFVGITTAGIAQNLNEHLWEERVILIFADAANSEMAQKQLGYFKSQEQAMRDRNTALYFCQDNSCEVYFSNFMKRSKRTKYLDNNFKVLLVGLDGGVKYESQQLEAAQVYFSKIDKMYLRKREMQRRINKKGG